MFCSVVCTHHHSHHARTSCIEVSPSTDGLEAIPPLKKWLYDVQAKRLAIAGVAPLSEACDCDGQTPGFHFRRHCCRCRRRRRYYYPTMTFAILGRTALLASTRRQAAVVASQQAVKRRTMASHAAAPEWTGIDKVVRGYFPQDDQRKLLPTSCCLPDLREISPSPLSTPARCGFMNGRSL